MCIIKVFSLKIPRPLFFGSKRLRAKYPIVIDYGISPTHGGGGLRQDVGLISGNYLLRSFPVRRVRNTMKEIASVHSLLIVYYN